MESKGRKLIALLLCTVGAALFWFALFGLGDLFFSAQAFRLHHEATEVLCRILAECAGAMLCGFCVMTLAGKTGQRPRFHELGAWIFLILMLLGAERVLANEAFFTMYDNKSIPVHPSRIVMHPLSGWITIQDYMILCILGIVAAAAFLYFSRPKKRIRN